MGINVRKTISFVFLMKAMVGCSLTMLAVFGVTVPHFGWEPTFVDEGVAAGFGAAVGAVLALRG